MIKELFLLTVFGFAVSNAVVCNRDTCSSFECGVLRCPDDYVIKKRGGFCGCCDNCVPALKEGDPCDPKPAVGGRPSHKGVTNSDPICGTGLMCDGTSLVCIPAPVTTPPPNSTTTATTTAV